MDRLLPCMSSCGDPSCSFWKTTNTHKAYETRSKSKKRQQKNKGCKRTRKGVVDMKGYRSEDRTNEDEVQGTNKTVHIELEGTSNEQLDVGSVDMEGNEVQDGSRMDSHATSTRVEGSSEDRQAEEQEATSSTHDGENVSFNALKENYKIPHDFKSLSQLAPNYKLECIFGVVTEFQPPSQSKGSDLVMKMFIMDPTCDGLAKEVLLFLPNKWKFPEVYCVGDIVRFHRIKAGCYCGNLQLISNFATSCMVFPGMGDNDVTLEMARHQTDKPSFSDEDICVVGQLRKWVKLNSHIIQPGVLVKIEEVQDQSFYNVVGKVVLAKRCQHQDYPWSITIYDDTRPQPESSQDDGISHQPDNLTNRPDNTTVPEPDHRILWDISKNLAKEKLITVHLSSKHARTVWDLKMKAGNVLLFHHVWAEFDEHAHLNLFMNNDGQRQSTITFVNPHSVLGREYEFK